MKRWMIAVLAASVVGILSAQSPEWMRDPAVEQLRLQLEIELPDSLVHAHPLDLPHQEMMPLRMEPVVSMSSVSVVRTKNLSDRIDEITNSLRLGRRSGVTVSNGQAWNWGSFQNSYLDARTLSFPMPR